MKDIKIMTGITKPIVTGRLQIKKHTICFFGASFIFGIPLKPGDLFEKSLLERA